MKKLPIIKKGFSGGIEFQKGPRIGSSLFLYGYFVVVIIFFVVLVLRLFQLTIVKGEYYRRVAEGNRLREIVVEPKRGTIIDRKGIIVAESFSADVDADQARITSPRRYPYGEVLAPLIGYRQIADEKDIKNNSCLNKITAGDKVGKKAVEKVYECELKGKNGRKVLEVDASGRPLATVMVAPAVDGKTLQLAIDAELQKKAYEIIKEKRAVVVGLQPQTGEVLLMTSSPSFNPQDFEDENSQKIAEYFNNAEKPLFNRATEGTYPPGSIFKVSVAAGALESKTVDERLEIEDTGKIKAGPVEFGNWYFLEYGKTEGNVSMVKALRRSNDIYFYKVGEKMGSDLVKEWAEKFGYGKKTGIHLDEAEGIVPSAFWKKEVLKEQWYLGDTYNLSIGQGYLLVTPLQVAQMTAIIANNGKNCKPELLKGQNSVCEKLPLSQKTLAVVQQGMVEACSPGGTGWPLFNFTVNSPVILSEAKDLGESRNATLDSSPAERVQNDKTIQVACKTGTAESHAESKKPHAWFTVYAPAQNPEIVLTVLVEEGGQGSDVAAPIARDILKAYFERAE